jgi:hypothetical protein
MAQFYQVFKWFMCEKTARPIFMQLAAVYMLKKQHFEKKISHRIMQSAIRLFVLDFS